MGVPYARFTQFSISPSCSKYRTFAGVSNLADDQFSSMVSMGLTYVNYIISYVSQRLLVLSEIRKQYLSIDAC